ncbi:hypothetical protein [Paenibacillus sp. 1001270B_150601_E10]|nr:hypothetical protein [Paenibacillus sp. 1001270B_150601_E10]
MKKNIADLLIKYIEKSAEKSAVNGKTVFGGKKLPESLKKKD